MLLNKLHAAVAAALLLLSGNVLAAEINSAEMPEMVGEEASEEADTLIYSVRLRVPNGASVWTADLGRNWSANPVKLRYVVESSCRAPYMSLFLRSSADGTWQKTNSSDGLDTHSLASFNGVRFELDQPWFGSVSCEFKLYGTDNGSGSAWGAGVLSGGIEYTGGFAHNLEVNISAADRIKGFRLAIPEFCQGAEILEAGTVTEGNYDPATLADSAKRIYKVASGSVRASRIRFSVNGPFDARCFIPVYTYGAD